MKIDPEIVNLIKVIPSVIYIIMIVCSPFLLCLIPISKGLMVKFIGSKIKRPEHIIELAKCIFHAPDKTKLPRICNDFKKTVKKSGSKKNKNKFKK